MKNLIFTLALFFMACMTSFAQCPNQVTQTNITFTLIKNSTKQVVTSVEPNTDYTLIAQAYTPNNPVYCLTPVLGFTNNGGGTATTCRDMITYLNKVDNFSFKTDAVLPQQGIWGYVTGHCGSIYVPLSGTNSIMFNFPKK